MTDPNAALSEPDAFEQTLLAVGFRVSASPKRAPLTGWEACVHDPVTNTSASSGGATRAAAVSSAHDCCVRPSPYADMLRSREGRVAGQTSRRAA